MRTRYIKVIRDLTSEYPKNFMLVLAIALGVFGIGAILGGYSVTKREMGANYMSTVPASATIEVEGNILPGLTDSIEKIPGIAVAERHATLVARMKIGDRWYPLLLFVIDDFGDKKTNKPFYISGAREPSVGAMLVERTAWVMMQAKEGEDILVKTPNGQPRRVVLSGTVHDPSLAPAWQEQAGYGYITLSTLHELGETQGFNQLRVLVSENQDSRDHITAEALKVGEYLKRNGYDVHEIQVPPPGKHPHQSQMNAVMTIFVVFSFLILVLGSILIATSTATLMVKQVRQIGVMKTIGADSMQVTVLYLVMIVILCIVALIVSIPLSRLVASVFYQQIAVLLNLEIRDESIPVWVPLLQIGSGIVIPVIAAAFPVIRGSRVPVRIALGNFGIAGGIATQRSWTIRLTRPAIFGEIFRLSLRNVFRQRSRLLMTLCLLAAGGAMFMTAMNVSTAWGENLKRIYIQRLYDLEVRLNGDMPSDSVLASVAAVPGVKTVEKWNSSSTSIAGNSSIEVTQTYPDKGHGSFVLMAGPVPTKLLNPTVVEGRWLHNAAANDVVLNQMARKVYNIGDQVVLNVDGLPITWNIIGFSEDVGSPATAYVSAEALAALTDSPVGVNLIRISYHDRARENARLKNRDVELLFENAGISVGSVVPVWLLHNAIAAHMKVLVNSLMAMAILMALVGSIGLMSTMSMNVLERTREIGVMRAIGATPDKIKKLIVWEGLLIGGLSIFAAFGISLLLSMFMGRFIGNLAFRTPLSLTISSLALAAWVVIIIIGSYLATLFPSRRANRITTREALAYE